MRKVMTAVVLMGALCLAPLSAFAAKAPAQAAAKKTTTATKAAVAPSHATTGTVKSMTSDALVITRPGKKGKDMSFVLNSSTQKEGNPEVGSKVSVRYRQEGTSMIATAVMAQGKAAPKKK